MESHAEHAHHHEMPTSGNALTGVAVSATLHCLTGCAIGEVAGMAIGTALGFSDLGTIALAVGLAFLFGYMLTSLPLLRAGFTIAAVIPIALASDTISIATMEIVDNAIMLIVPGAMEAGLGDVLFWGALSFALAVAFVLTVPVNRYLIARGKGHTAVHNTGIHGGPPTRVVGAAVILAAVFGTTVLLAEAIGEEGAEGGGHEASMAAEPTPSETVRGVTVAEDGLRLQLDRTQLSIAHGELRFRVLGADGAPVTEFEVEHTKRMHLIVVRRDLTGFQHLHPVMTDDGAWSTPIELDDAGSYRVFADFNHDGESVTLGADLAVDGPAEYEVLPVQQTETETASDYEVGVEGVAAVAGQENELAFNVVRRGRDVDVEPYLGADGHLVALREGDLAFLHVHPVEHEEAADTGAQGDSIRFITEFPTAGNYRLFLQFKHGGEVHTAAFTRVAAGGDD
jgi:hypothetical protein